MMDPRARVYFDEPHEVSFTVTPSRDWFFTWAASMRVSSVPGGGTTLTGYGHSPADAATDLEQRVREYGIEERP